MPVLYKTAYLIYDHAETSKNDRWNNDNAVNAAMVKERKDRMDFEYTNSMNNLLQNIKPPSDELCFECKNNVKHVVMIP